MAQPGRVLFAAVIALAAAAAGMGETYRVSDLGTLATILGEKAEPGDVVEIAPGTYYLSEKKIAVTRSGSPEAPIVIRGVMEDGKRPVIDAGKVNVMRGIFYIEEETHDIVIENLELCNAAGGGHEGQEQPRNAAAVYVIGKNVTIRNCYCHHNENGLFSTHESDYVLVDACEIDSNGRAAGVGEPHRTHNFYFNSKHQMVKGSYIHSSTEGENFKSRGGNVIFAYNWVDEEAIYSVAVDSANEMNTLWLGNVVVKRTTLGYNQGRLLGVGDGTGVARGTLVAVNNTFVTMFPRDFYLFTEWTAETDVVLINNVFAGMGEVFLEKHGKGEVTGKNNWIMNFAGDVPEGLTGTIRGDAAGFVDGDAFDFHLREGSPLVDAGVSEEEYRAALKIVLDNSKSGTEATPSREWLAALAEIEKPTPSYSPKRKATGQAERAVEEKIDIGAYELVKTK